MLLRSWRGLQLCAARLVKLAVLRAPVATRRSCVSKCVCTQVRAALGRRNRAFSYTTAVQRAIRQAHQLCVVADSIFAYERAQAASSGSEMYPRREAFELCAL